MGAHIFATVVARCCRGEPMGFGRSDEGGKACSKAAVCVASGSTGSSRYAVPDADARAMDRCWGGQDGDPTRAVH